MTRRAPSRADVSQLLAALLRAGDGNSTPADDTLLRSHGLVHDYPATGYDAGKVFHDVLTAEAKNMCSDIGGARRKVAEIRERLDAIARDEDREWALSGGRHPVPLGNVTTSPGYRHWQGELKRADRERMKVEAAIKARLRKHPAGSK